MPPEIKRFLSDALECAKLIEQFTAQKNFDDFEREDITRSAVYYRFAVIGEALTQIKRIDKGTFDRISDSPRIVGFRNQLIHGYQGLQDNVVWQIIQEKLPVLRNELEGLLTE